VNPPIAPMLSKRIGELPAGKTWIFETEVGWLSRAGFPRWRRDPDSEPRRKILNRYFPELLDPIRAQLPPRCVLDGENRHRDEWRSRLRAPTATDSSGGLASEAAGLKESPASIVFFDLLCEGDRRFAARTIPTSTA